MLKALGRPLDVLDRFNLAMGCCLLDIYPISVLFHILENGEGFDGI
jgi:hypothetical protein